MKWFWAKHNFQVYRLKIGKNAKQSKGETYNHFTLWFQESKQAKTMDVSRNNTCVCIKTQKQRSLADRCRYATSCKGGWTSLSTEFKGRVWEPHYFGKPRSEDWRSSRSHSDELRAAEMFFFQWFWWNVFLSKGSIPHGCFLLLDSLKTNQRNRTNPNNDTVTQNGAQVGEM